jgi:uncharacterized protein
MTRCFFLAFVMLCNQDCFAQSDFFSKLTAAAIDLTYDTVHYDPSYFSIPYPNGDIPKEKGVCTDVIIRAYRKAGIDLQQRVHEDMKEHFHLYPKIWGLISTDRNIDHRRVPNLMTFFARNGTSLKLSSVAEDYQPGDIVTWILNSGVPHIGILVNRKSKDGVRNMVVHNIGNGQEITDCLFIYKITGHYRYPGIL